mmetsp:Transcript_44290/g.96246  ORF Transcript_44290/g.96246 Transcript_44290/m.96246 type:complete len:552 (-) Transcript_44290:170-1825(-)
MTSSAPAPAAPAAVPAAASPAPESSLPVAGATAGAGAAKEETSAKELSEAQRKVIEGNKRKALELRKKRAAAEETSQTSPARPAAPGKAEAKTTPEKEPMPVERRSAERSKFTSISRAPWMQYNDLYNVRLDKLRPHVLKEAKCLWTSSVGPAGFVPEISQFRKAGSGEVVILGIVIRDMPARPDVIAQYRDHQAGNGMKYSDEVQMKRMASADDALWLEDPSMRVRLEFTEGLGERLVTGLVLAAKGLVTDEGLFRVSALCLGSMPASSPLPAPKSTEANQYLAFVSGLMLGSPAADVAARDRMVSFLTRSSGDAAMDILSSSICRLVVCGDSIDGEARNRPGGVAAALEEADELFEKVAAVMPVDVMPGRTDPANYTLPQEPLHPFLFRRSRSCNGFRSVKNPYDAMVDSLHILGHSGQPVEDIMRCSLIERPLEALSLSFEALHLAPTAPDTLATQPFKDADPFIIDTVPHVLFSGGHDREAHAWRAGSAGGTQILCVPSFASHAAVVLVNLHDPRDVRVQEFSTCGDGDVQMGGVPGAADVAMGTTS